MNSLQNSGDNFETLKVVKKRINISLGVQKISSYNLGSFISSTESRNIIIVTRGRSGSSFVGQLLSQYPGTFYSYEPLHYRNLEASKEEQVRLIKRVFQCIPSHEYIQHPKQWPSVLTHNFRYRDACRDLYIDRRACFFPYLYQTACSLFPIRLIKSIRFPFEHAENLLLDPKVGKTLKIIFLFRDPRGRLQSLKSKVHWCKPRNETIDRCNVSNLCGDLSFQVLEAINVKKKYAGKILIGITY